MIDIHTHVLPGVDDGAADAGQAQAMLEMAAEDGTRVLVATPHFDLRYQFERESCQALVRDLAERAPAGLRVCLGCEVHLTLENMDRLLHDPSKYSLDGGDCILLELPLNTLPPMVDYAVEALMDRGLRVIIAHPERYPFLQQQHAFPERLVEAGCYLQLTAGSLSGSFGPAAEACAGYLLNRRLAHFVASDAHGVERRRPLLSAAWNKVAGAFGSEAADLLFRDNPAAALNGSEIRRLPSQPGWLAGLWSRSNGIRKQQISTQMSWLRR